MPSSFVCLTIADSNVQSLAFEPCQFVQSRFTGMRGLYRVRRSHNDIEVALENLGYSVQTPDDEQELCPDSVTRAPAAILARGL
jgi:hypothetical protein